jgi:predicted DNA-binding transcriptional regulator AlpA
MNEILTVKQLAELLSTTPQSIRNQISRGREGISVPPSFKLGARCVWLRDAVMAWLHARAGVVAAPQPKPARPEKAEQLARRCGAPSTPLLARSSAP